MGKSGARGSTSTTSTSSSSPAGFSFLPPLRRSVEAGVTTKISRVPSLAIARPPRAAVRMDVDGQHEGKSPEAAMISRRQANAHSSEDGAMHRGNIVPSLSDERCQPSSISAAPFESQPRTQALGLRHNVLWFSSNKLWILFHYTRHGNEVERQTNTILQVPLGWSASPSRLKRVEKNCKHPYSRNYLRH
jgi:hypothetical protein